jgi:chromosome segregation ATPase
MAETYKKIDEETVEITTTSEPVVNKATEEKAILRTRLSHIPDDIAELQGQIDKLNTDKTRLENILKVFD